MRFWQKSAEFDLSVVVVFHDMRREAKRTLFSLTDSYQQNMKGYSYEVIAIDNGSSEPLDAEWVSSFGENFRYVYYETELASPCKALNHGAQLARGKHITFCIDGARILSPGILYYSLLATGIYKNPFIYTLGMHIGKTQQNHLDASYTARDEDELIASTAWERDGYSLFEIAAPAFSNQGGYFSKLTESNCVTLTPESFEKVGGFDERFKSPGGGLANPDFFNRVNEIAGISPIMLLGEATFHQYHGGTTTNVPLDKHPWREMSREYEKLRGRAYQRKIRKPAYFGTIHPKCYPLISVPTEGW